jgi:acyl-CoA synthetase (AMP-forming)/AMP-acid ligase II
MELGLLLEMAASADADRVLVGSREDGLTAGRLHRLAHRGARLIRDAGVAHVVYVGANGPAFPVALFAAAVADVPLVPLNYRLPAEQLTRLVVQNSPALLIADESVVVTEKNLLTWTPEEWLARTTAEADGPGSGAPSVSADSVALLLYTSGTTAEPKAAVLRHRHLTAYVLSTIEFACAGDDEATLVSVPPYHIAGVANAVTNVYAGRRIVYLSAFTPQDWLRTVREEGITHALVVPTMLARVVEHLGAAAGADVPSLRSLAYGGAPMPRTVIERALALFPDTDFVNAYGLTETSSTIALLGPDDHRVAAGASDEAVRARLSSVGRAVPGIELQIRADDGTVCPPGVPGQLWVRGDQVAGEYRGMQAGKAEDWFCTRDQARLDAGGFLFIDGRVDDTIIRGGENIAPAEIEEVLLQHPGVADVVVVGVPDEEWGQKITAVLVARAGYDLALDDVRAWARQRLRSSKAPQLLIQADELPRTDTGKLLRRQVVAELTK